MISVIRGKCQGKKAFAEEFLLSSLEESIVPRPSTAFGPSAASGQSGPSGVPGPPVIQTYGAGADWGTFMDGMYCDDLHLFIRRLMLEEPVCGEGRGTDGIRGMTDVLMRANLDRILVTDEIRYGIVPVSPFERQYQEAMGRICRQTVGYASQMRKVYCGIGQRVKRQGAGENMGWLELWKFHSTALLAGCTLDWMFGDPVCIPHLIRLMDRMIARLELELRRRMKGRELVTGAVLTFITYAVWWTIPWGLFCPVRSTGFSGSFLLFPCLETFICYQAMAARGLCTESMEVYRSLEDEGVEMVRHYVSMIVGKDISVPDRDSIAGATIETVAENVSDGVVAPFLFMALLGPTGKTFYKVVNTMDSMIGYKNDAHQFSGYAAALLDDVLNLIPVRATGYLMVLAVFFIPGVDGMNGWRIFLRDRREYANPNSTHGEVACVGIFRLRLTGDVWYFGSLHKKPFIGEDNRPTVPADIERTSQLMLAAQGVLVAVLATTLVAV